jgi:alkylation response protein AidB-like acyl-CoA dehydrogenase
MNAHLVKIREICAFLRQIVPICYLQAIQHKLDEIVAEVDAMKAILEREGL